MALGTSGNGGAGSDGAAGKPEFWAGAVKPKAPAKPPMKRWKKLVIFGGGGLALLLVVGVALAPTIAGSLAPGMVRSGAAEQIAGPVSVGSASFSWTGTQKIGPITLYDQTKPAGSNEIATVNIEVSRGLFALATGGLDLGEITVSGNARVVRYAADGTTNLDHALRPGTKPIPKEPAPGKGGASEPARLPKGLNATLIINALDVVYVDEASPASNASLKGLKGEASIGPGASDGTSVRVKLGAKASGGSSSAKDAPGGTLKIDAKIDQLADSSGTLQPDKAKVDATVVVDGLPTELVDALAGMGGRLAKGLGPVLGLNLGAKGTMKSASASVKFESAGATAQGDFVVDNSVLTTGSPLVANVTGAALRAIGDVDATLAKSGSATLSKAPDVTLSVDALRFKIPSGGKPDLAGTSANIVLKTTEASGTLKLQESGAPSPFVVSPVEARVTTTDLAGTVKMNASGNATVGGQPAGVLNVDLTASNVLALMKGGGGSGGGGGATLPAVQGVVQLKGVATPIAQPFVAGAGLDLSRDIGPTLDVEMKIATAAGGAGSIPPVTADLSIASAKLNAKGAFELKDAVLKSSGGPFTLNADAVGGLLSRFVDAKAAYAIAPGGKLTVTISDVVVPFKEGDLSKAQLDKAGATAQLGVQGLSVTPRTAGAAGNLDVGTFTLGAIAAPGAAPKISLNGAMSYAGKPFTLAGAMEVPGLYSFKPDGTPMVTPVGARPSGTIDLKNVPTAIASLFAPATPPAPAAPGAPTPAAPTLDMGKFLSDALGPGIDVKLASSGAKGADGVDFDVAVRAERLTSDVKARLSDKSVDVKQITAAATVAPSTLDTVLATYAPNLTPRPQLAGTSKLTLAVDPVTFPVGKGKDGEPRLDLAKAGIATVKITLPEQTLLQNMVLKNADGTTKNLGQLGVEALELVVKAPLAMADATAAAVQKFDITVGGRVLDGPGSAMMKLAGTASGEMSGAGGVQTADADFKLTDVRVASIDRLAGQPGLVSGAIGDSAAVNLGAKVRPASGGKSTDVEVSLLAPRVKMAEPLRASMLPDRLKSNGTAQITWQVDPTWANQNLLADKSGAPSPKLSGPATVGVTISKFAISSGDGHGPLVPAIFELAMTSVVNGVEFAMPDGSKIKLTGTRAGAESKPGGSIPGAAVGFNVNVDEISVTQTAGTPPPAKGVAISGTVTGLSDAQGQVTPQTAAVTADADVPVIPTALVDLLAKQNGLLVDALGPTTSVKLRADRFGASGGTLDLVAKSDRATASVRGAVADKVFVTSEPIKASLTEVTTALAKRFIKGMPLIGSVEKKPTDEPALITASTMRVPMDNDMRKLDGEIVIDPGVARFTAGDTFGGILKALNQKTEANIGQRIDPLNVHIKQGIATYDKWTVPLGQNKVNTQGNVDLVNQTVDVITYVPLGALTEDVAGLFKAQAKLKQALGGKGLEDTLMVPFRSRGPFSKVKTEPDMELFAKETLKSLKPEDVLKKGLDDLLKPKPKPEGGGK